jgi:hypothetical protein
MPHANHKKTGLEEAGESLFNFAVDREDIKASVGNLPAEAKCEPSAVEYELQLLKIIATGWAISFFLENHPLVERLAENFWRQIHDFSRKISETTGLMTGQDIDYFQILKDRLDWYVSSMTSKKELTEPAVVIGPEFARFCGDADDVFTIMTGSRIFILTVARVKNYLDSIELQ